MSDTPATAPVGSSGRRRRRGSIFLALNVVLLVASVALFATPGSRLARWLLLITCSLNTVNSWQSWRAR